MKLNYDNIEIEIKQIKPVAFNTSQLNLFQREEMLSSWKNYIKDVIYTRLIGCKTSLLNNMSNVYYSDDALTCYSKSGIDKHYSVLADKAMQDILTFIEQDKIGKILEREDCIVQLLKALYVIPQNSIRQERIDGTDFYSLIDMLFVQLTEIKLNK